MVDSIDSGNVGGVGSVDGGRGVDAERPEVQAEESGAADRVGPRGVDAQAQMTAGGDGFEGGAGGVAGLSGARRSPGAGGSGGGPNGGGPAGGSSEPAKKEPALKDGDWLHNPRELTPEKAKELQDLIDKGNLHPQSKKAIEQFLDDYRNGRDSLFPDDPNPLHKPYPTNPAPQNPIA